MNRTLPTVLALLLVGCGSWPTAHPGSGQLLVENPLYARFQAKVIPDSARKLVILVTTRSDEQSRPAALVTMDASERQKIISDIPVGRADVVVAAFNGTFDPVAANASDVTIVPSLSGQRTRLAIELSTDEGLLRRLANALARMKPGPTPSPSAGSDATAQPSVRPSVRPSLLPSAQPSRDPLAPIASPSAAPSPTASASGLPLFNLPVLASFTETFAGPELDATRWLTRISGTPTPTISVGDGLTVVMPAGATNAEGGVITSRMTFFDVEAGTRVAITGGAVNETTQVGLFTTGAGLYRTVKNGSPVYVLERTGDVRSVAVEIPAPAAGGVDQFRIVRQGLTFRGFAGPVGDMKPVGMVPAAFGAIPMQLGIRSTDAGRTGVTAQFRGAAVGLLTTPSPAP